MLARSPLPSRYCYTLLAKEKGVDSAACWRQLRWYVHFLLQMDRGITLQLRPSLSYLLKEGTERDQLVGWNPVAQHGLILKSTADC